MYNNVGMQLRLTKDATFKKVGDSSVTKFSGACDRNYLKQGEEKPTTDFFNAEKWGLKEDFVKKHLKKGKLVVVQGSIENNFYEDDKGKHYDQVIKVEHVFITDFRKDNEGENQGEEQGE